MTMQTVTHTIIGLHQAPDGREQMGRFLRYAFPLRLESFADVDEFLAEDGDAHGMEAPALFAGERLRKR